MKASYLYFLIIVFLLCGCTHGKKNTLKKSKHEIIETERAFNKMAQQEGIAAAFLHFAADSAVLMRNNKLIIGKAEIRKSFGNDLSKQEGLSLTWEPDYVDVSASGDLGYTYGQYIYSLVDSTGITQRDTGIFHTVWKRQADGNWRFVWD
jgi:ketosteroid isomerase-like protein